MALMNIKWGTTVSPVAVDRFRGKEGIPNVIAILNKDEELKAAKTHYVDGLRHFYCFEGECCENHGTPSVAYIVPIVEYQVLQYPGPGKRLDYGMPVQVKYLKMGKGTYNEFQMKDSLKGITNHDLFVTCVRQDMQELNFEFLDGLPKWRQDGDIQRVIAREWPRYQKLLEISVARELTPERYRMEYASLMSKSGGTAPNRPSAPPPTFPEKQYGFPGQASLGYDAPVSPSPVDQYLPQDEPFDLSKLMGGPVEPPKASEDVVDVPFETDDAPADAPADEPSDAPA